MRRVGRRLTPLGGAALVWLVMVAPTVACSPPFEEPTIEALGPGQVVVVGSIGEPVDGGRVFHVERWFNGGEPQDRIVIAFKEGEPVGDCSYPVQQGQRLIIAPYLDERGRLASDLVTLQADPESEAGRRYVAEAVRLFGPGVEMAGVPDVVPEPAPDPLPVVLAAAAVIGVAGGLWLAFRR